MSNAPVIDPDEIVIEAAECDPPDQRFNFRLPADCVKKIVARLAQEDQPLEGKPLFSLLSQICLDECVGRFELRPIWGPVLIPGKGSPQPTPEDDFCFSALVDTVPDLQWPAFDSLSFDRPVLTLDASMVDAELDEQQLDAGTAESSTAPLERGDQALTSVTLVLAETDSPLADTVEVTIRIPAPGRPALVEGLPIAGLHEAMLGMSCGESKDFDSTVPVGLGGDQHTGQPMRCSIAVQSAERLAPASVEAVVARFGSPSEATLRRQIQQSLEQRFDREQKQYLVDQVFGLLMEQIECPVPRRVVAKSVSEEQKNMMVAMIEQGHDEQEARTLVEQAAAQLVAAATERCRRSVLCTLLQWQFQLKASEADIQEQIRLIASNQGKRPEQVRKDLIDSGRIDAVTKQVIEQKVVDRILGEATVEDVPAMDLGLAGA